MRKQENNYAFIDSQNLNLSIRERGWKLDFKKFFIYLKEKYSIRRVYLFIGYIHGNQSLYTSLQKIGYICVFKPILEINDDNGNCKVKGNVDADLVLHTMIEYPNYNKAIIISGDGDFYCLVEYLIEHNKLKKLLIPNQSRYSKLLKKFPSEYLAFVSDLKHKLAYISNKKKTP